MKSAWKNRRGISEVLAATVLIVLAATAGVALYGFLAGFFSSSMGLADVYVEPQLIAPAGSGAATWSVAVFNGGSVAIKDVSVSLYNGSALLSNITYMPLMPIGPSQGISITQFGNMLISPVAPSQKASSSANASTPYLKAGKYAATLVVTDGAGHRGFFNMSFSVVNSTTIFSYLYLIQFGNKLLAVANVKYMNGMQNNWLVIWDKTASSPIAYTNSDNFIGGSASSRFVAYVLGNATAGNAYFAYIGPNPDSPNGAITTTTTIIATNVSQPSFTIGALFPFFPKGKPPLTVIFNRLSRAGGYTYSWEIDNKTANIGVITTLSGNLNNSNIIAGETYSYRVVVVFTNGASKTITGSVTASSF